MTFSKSSIIIFIVILMSISIVSAYSVKIDISESFEGKPLFFNTNISGNLVKFSTEFYNTGNIAYRARMRLDVFDNNSLIFSGWSPEKPLLIGDRNVFDIFWYSEYAGNFTSIPRFYFGNEIVAYDPINISIEDTSDANNSLILSITDISYDEIKIHVESGSEEVIIIPYDYPTGWIFEQNTTKGSEAIIKYDPSLWTPKDVSLYAVSLDGKKYGKNTFKLNVKEESDMGLFSIILFIIRILL